MNLSGSQADACSGASLCFLWHFDLFSVSVCVGRGCFAVLHLSIVSQQDKQITSISKSITYFHSHQGFFVCVCVFFIFQGAVRRVHDPIRQFGVQPRQPRPLRVQRPVAGGAVGGAAEGAGPGAIVWRFSGGPRSHEVAETLLQVSRRSSLATMPLHSF